MTDHYQPPPWMPAPLAALTGIPVHLDPTVPAGTALLDTDPDEPRHITGIRATDTRFQFTAEQTEQVRDHYRAIDERAADLLAWWQQHRDRLSHPATDPRETPPMDHQRPTRPPRPELPPLPLGWKLWMGFCATLGLSVLGVGVWAVITVVNHHTR